MFNLGSFLSTILGQDNTKKLREFTHQVEKINNIEQEFENKSPDELKLYASELKARHSNGEELDSLLIESFALV